VFWEGSWKDSPDAYTTRKLYHCGDRICDRIYETSPKRYSCFGELRDDIRSCPIDKRIDRIIKEFIDIPNLDELTLSLWFNTSTATGSNTNTKSCDYFAPIDLKKITLLLCKFDLIVLDITQEITRFASSDNVC
jgi:hypothetical protein